MVAERHSVPDEVLVLADAAIQAYTHITGPQSGTFGHAGGNQRNFTAHSAGASASPRLLQSLCVSLATPACTRLTVGLADVMADCPARGSCVEIRVLFRGRLHVRNSLTNGIIQRLDLAVGLHRARTVANPEKMERTRC